MPSRVQIFHAPHENAASERDAWKCKNWLSGMAFSRQKKVASRSEETEHPPAGNNPSWAYGRSFERIFPKRAYSLTVYKLCALLTCVYISSNPTMKWVGSLPASDVKTIPNKYLNIFNVQGKCGVAEQTISCTLHGVPIVTARREASLATYTLTILTLQHSN